MADSPRIEELKRRVQMDPASIAFAALAEEYRRAERYDEAIETCTAGLVRHPSYLSAHVTLGRALMEVGRLQEAQQELEFVLRLAPENLAAIRGLAEIHRRLGDDHEHQELHAGTQHPSEVSSAVDERATIPFKTPDFLPETPAVSPAVERNDATCQALEQLLAAIERARAGRAHRAAAR